jgi:hypothetical protein
LSSTSPRALGATDGSGSPRHRDREIVLHASRLRRVLEWRSLALPALLAAGWRVAGFALDSSSCD